MKTQAGINKLGNMVFMMTISVMVLAQTPLMAGDTNMPVANVADAKPGTNVPPLVASTNAPAAPVLPDITIRGIPYFAMIQYSDNRPVLWISIKDSFNTKYLAMIECNDPACGETNHMIILRDKVFAAKTNRTESILSGTLDKDGLNGTREVVYPAKLQIGPDPLHNLIPHPHHSGMF